MVLNAAHWNDQTIEIGESRAQADATITLLPTIQSSESQESIDLPLTTQSHDQTIKTGVDDKHVKILLILISCKLCFEF